jgi:predicted RNase H-like HicB family nuclease
MSDYHINIFYSEEDGGYIADIPDLDSCSAFGQTPEQALSEVERAKTAWLEAAGRVGSRFLRRVTDRSFTRSRGKY